MNHYKRFALIGSALGAILVGVQAAPLLFNTCPPSGSGAEGVADWTRDNCDGSTCASVATTCNGEFEIALLGITSEGSLKTFEYQVCQVGGQAALSHWSISTVHMRCLDEDKTFADLIVGGTLNGQPTGLRIGLDPTTQVVGFKFDEGVRGGCNLYTVTFDTSALGPGWTLGTTCVTASTKAGNQDIRFENVPSPGYACIEGPACELDTGGGDEGCTPGFWKNHTELWVATGHAPGDLVGGVFQGSLYGNSSLLAALNFGGGPGVAGAQRILLRAAVAALLNAADPGINYGLDEAQVILDVEAALATEDRDVMLTLAAELDDMNNAGCPY